MITNASGSSPSRRTVVAAAAWSAPVVAASVAAPAASASTPETNLALVNASGGASVGGGPRLRPGDGFEFHFALENRGAATIPALARVEMILTDTEYLEYFEGGSIVGPGWSLQFTAGEYASFIAVLATPILPGATSAPAVVTFTYPAGAVTRIGGYCGVALSARSDEIIDDDGSDNQASFDLQFLRRYAVVTATLTAPLTPVLAGDPVPIELELHNGGPNTIQGEPSEVWLEFNGSFTQAFGSIDRDADNSALLVGSSPAWSLIDFADDPIRSLVAFRIGRAIDIGDAARLVFTPSRAADGAAGDMVVALNSLFNREVETQLPAGNPSAALLFN